MPQILNVNNTHNLDLKKLHKKLSFEIGEKFAARIINLDNVTNEAILKLLDGWQFSAKVREPKNFTLNKLIRFQVDGYDQDEIILKILGDKEGVKENSLVDILEEQGINVKKHDYSILEKMVKHNMPLTRENISKVESLLNFQNKIVHNEKEEDNFILKYLNNRGISIDSEKGQNIQKLLKGFFREFKEINTDELFTMLENDIEFTEENIKSFNKINKESSPIYKELIDIGRDILKNSSKEVNLDKNIDKDVLEIGSKEVTLDKSISNKSSYVNDNKEVSQKEAPKVIFTANSEDVKIEVLKENTSLQNKGVNSNGAADNSKIEEKINSNMPKEDIKVQPKDMELHKDFNKNILNNKSTEAFHRVKEELTTKTYEMKNIVKRLIEEMDNSKSEVFNKVLHNLQNSTNDFKVFNSISNQYYYLDVPVKFNNEEYPCKLIVKDDRKKGKKIDSTNVKFAVCVKTINMGTVDAYIKILNTAINVDINCEEPWVNVLKLGKEKLSKQLLNKGFNVNIDVNPKEKEVNLVNCRGFFEDNELTRINFIV